MITKEQIRDIVSEKFKGSDFFIVDIKVDLSNNIQVEVDKYSGFSIADCIELNRFIEKRMNREEEDFSLQVSSPGLEKPFKVFDQYKKNVGKEIEVLTSDEKKVRGLLKEVTEKNIVLEYTEKLRNEKNKKIEIIKTETVEFPNIKEAKIILKFK